MFNWRETKSIPEKQRLVERHFGKKVPRYLFFAIKDTSPLTAKEKAHIEQLFGMTHSFFSHSNHPNKKGLGSSLNLNTFPENPSSIRILRIRDGTRMHYSFEIKGQTCHLLQASADDDKGVNFLDLWARVADDQAKRPQEPATESTRILHTQEEVTRIREFGSREDKEGTIVILDPRLLTPEKTEETSFMLLPRQAPLFANLSTKKKTWMEKLKELLLG
ncbi:hypothetical protein HYV70_01265 [Candidatus Uhrbacteria bacterium]|nr:hypothetical protein [Candidatus Uhrbacteria bacterium]